MISLYDRWKNLKSNIENSVFQRVDEEHKLDFYIGINTTGEKSLLLVTDNEPPMVKQSQSISIRTAQRRDGRWATIFSLRKSEHEQIFIKLCEDLVESSRNIDNISMGASFVLNRFSKWQRLLEYVRSGLLDKIAIRGLIGELLVLEYFAIPKYGIQQAVDSWIGPTGADQDYVFNDCWYEVKSIHTNSTVIKISSIEQLDTENNGELITVCLEDAVKDEMGSFNLYDFIVHLKEMITVHPLSYMKFEEKLLEAGYIELEEYKEQYFINRGIKRYNVDGNFPKVCRENISPEIKNLTYELEIPMLYKYEILV